MNFLYPDQGADRKTAREEFLTGSLILLHPRETLRAHDKQTIFLGKPSLNSEWCTSLQL
jgi:hypothetical protein